MDEIVNSFSLARDKLMSEMPLRQSGFTYKNRRFKMHLSKRAR